MPLVHPVLIHLKVYRESYNPEIKYRALKAAHDYIWPKEDLTWNYWSERRFREHCEDWKTITYAGGGSTGKSRDAAKIAGLFWMSNPRKHAVLVASTTLESILSRIYGYVTSLFQKAEIDFPYNIRTGNANFIEYPGAKDALHTIRAVAAKKGDDETKISSLIGRHPEKGLLIILDEATDLPVGLLDALPNLESCPFFQVIAIGNSNSKFDLHGALSTPKDGWGSINPETTNKWETTQDRGVCLFFSCYDSPAIHEKDPVRKAALSKFLITTEKIEAKKLLYGAKSDSFYRFVLGFWKHESTDSTVISRAFLNEFHSHIRAEWSGYYPLVVVAGLDPAFSTGGDKCILQLGVLGQDVNGKMLLDFMGERLRFHIQIDASNEAAAELQIAEQVIKIMKAHNCPLGNLVIDSNGQGRALAGVIQLKAGVLETPIKIYTTGKGNQKAKSFDCVIKTSEELWYDVRRFVEADSLRGLNEVAMQQFTSRLTVANGAGKERLETKAEYKVRMRSIRPDLGHSPDEADGVALCLQSAMLTHGFSAGMRREITEVKGFANQKMEGYKLALAVEESNSMRGGRAAGVEGDFTCDLADAVLVEQSFTK